jgi:hypothetical protein
MHRFDDIRAKFNAMKKDSQKSRGLGDSIEKFTKATGIKAVVDKVSKVTGKDCGCGQRRDALNRVFPYNRD